MPSASKSPQIATTSPLYKLAASVPLPTAFLAQIQKDLRVDSNLGSRNRAVAQGREFLVATTIERHKREVSREQIPPDLQPEVGQQLQIQQPNGQPVAVFVTDVTDAKVTLDANHPLAGEDLTFDIHLVEIA
jgi:hypothetical protein